MKKYTFNICKRIFTRDWNLRRHMQDVHRLVADYTKKTHINQENGYYPPPINNIFYKENKMDYSSNYKQNPYYHNNFYNYFPNHGYYLDGSFPSNFNSQTKENRRLNVDDKIKIQKVLQILENHLYKIGIPIFFVSVIITWLNHRCFIEKSYEPLKKYLTDYNLGYLWSY